MHTHSTPLSEIQTRIRALQEHLAREGLDGALIIHHTNLYYYSGTSQSAHLFVPNTGEAMLMVRKSFERARQESPLPVVLDVQSPKGIPALLREYGHGTAAIGLELDIIPFNTYGYYAKIFSDTTLTDISRTVRQLRMIKSAYEVDLLLASGRTLVPIEIKAAYTPGDDLSKGVRRFAALTTEAVCPTVIYAGRDIPAHNAPSFLNFEHTATLIHGCP